MRQNRRATILLAPVGKPSRLAAVERVELANQVGSILNLRERKTMTHEPNAEYYAVAIVRMEDEPLHTQANGYRCFDLSCPCNEQELNREPECPPGYFWTGRQCLREMPYPTLSLAERMGF